MAARGRMSPRGDELAGLIRQAERIVAFSGAGLSTESGISDYRSKGGLWERFQPVTIQEFMADGQKRKEYWRRKKELMEQLAKSAPNDGHRAITALQRMGKLLGVITQNIDGLQQEAGLPAEKILELHGTNREIICLSCGAISPWNEVLGRLQSAEEVPLCDGCGGLLKPNTISFGQALVPEVLQKASRWASQCDLLLAVGSTLVVEPAASLPRMARAQGAKLVIVTLSQTPLDGLADLKITAPAGETLSQAIVLLNEKERPGGKGRPGGRS